MPYLLNRVVFGLLYCAALSWIYLNEIVLNWSYDGFLGKFSFTAMAFSLGMTGILSALVPNRMDVRSILLYTMNYIFFIPYVVYLGYSEAPTEHFWAFIIMIVCVYGIPAMKIQAPVFVQLTQKQIMVAVFGAIFLALASQAAYGGVKDFNLELDRVYEFRMESALQVPGIFAYIFSSVASVLLPLALVLSLKFRQYWLSGTALLSAVILFGMSHHKSVLFGPFAVAGLYVIFSRLRSISPIGWIFLALPIVCLVEIYYLRVIEESYAAAYLNSLLIRRVLFVPAMLDGLYIEYFDLHSWYYWSQSFIASWALENPHGYSAPYIIGQEYFHDIETSANTGVIGSGFANAGMFGVAIYSVLAGLVLALLNAFGERIGHPLVAATSFTTVFIVLTSADFLTTILSHGLFILIVFLSLFPEAEENRLRRASDVSHPPHGMPALKS